MITDVSAVRTHVPARDDTSSEVISVSLFKVHFVRHSGVSLCLCVVSLSWIDDDWSSAFVLLGHSSVSGSMFPVSLSSASPVEVRPLSIPMCPLSLCASSLWLFALSSVRFICLKSLSLSCVSCFILKVPGPVCYVTLLWCLPSVLCAL